mgnify:CR=1 FL=1
MIPPKRRAAASPEEGFLLVPSRDVSGHGTAVAGIAAGSTHVSLHMPCRGAFIAAAHADYRPPHLRSIIQKTLHQRRAVMRAVSIAETQIYGGGKPKGSRRKGFCSERNLTKHRLMPHWQPPRRRKAFCWCRAAPPNNLFHRFPFSLFILNPTLILYIILL